MEQFILTQHTDGTVEYSISMSGPGDFGHDATEAELIGQGPTPAPTHL